MVFEKFKECLENKKIISFYLNPLIKTHGREKSAQSIEIVNG